MSKDRLNELKEELKLAKEANELTVENIGKIVSDATTDIVKELKFDKDKTKEVAKVVIDTTTDALKEFEELTEQNIKATHHSVLDGIQNALHDDLDFHTKKFNELKHIITDDWPEEMKFVFHETKDDAIQTLEDIKAFSELSLDLLKQTSDKAIKSIKDTLKK